MGLPLRMRFLFWAAGLPSPAFFSSPVRALVNENFSSLFLPQIIERVPLIVGRGRLHSPPKETGLSKHIWKMLRGDSLLISKVILLVSIGEEQHVVKTKSEASRSSASGSESLF